jgi:galactosylgalactosylxylosylprotein 3-beta-glucuronosyltransferase 3
MVEVRLNFALYPLIPHLIDRTNINVRAAVVYFADDDNTYDLRVFDEMRSVRAVGVWPVGLVGGMMVERPIVDTVTNKVNGIRVEGFYWQVIDFIAWQPGANPRPFPMDMAGFAIHISLLTDNPKVYFVQDAGIGQIESTFLQSLGVTRDMLEPKAEHCTKVYVWHTQTAEVDLRQEKRLAADGRRPSDYGIDVV